MRRKEFTNKIVRKAIIMAMAFMMSFASIGATAGTMTVYAAETQDGSESGSGSEGASGSEGTSGSESGEKAEKAEKTETENAGGVVRTYEISEQRAEIAVKKEDAAKTEAAKETAEAATALGEAQSALSNLEVALGASYNEAEGTYTAETTEAEGKKAEDAYTKAETAADNAEKAEKAASEATELVDGKDGIKELTETAVALDPTSETFEADLAEIAGTVAEKVAEVKQKEKEAKQSYEQANRGLTDAINQYNAFVREYNKGKQDAEKLAEITKKGADFNLTEVAQYLQTLSVGGEEVEQAKDAVDALQTTAAAAAEAVNAANSAKEYAQTVIDQVGEWSDETAETAIKTEKQELDAALEKTTEKKDAVEAQNSVAQLVETAKQQEEAYQDAQDRLDSLERLLAKAPSDKLTIQALQLQIAKAQNEVALAKKAKEEAAADVKIAENYQSWLTFLKDYNDKKDSAQLKSSAKLGLFAQVNKKDGKINYVINNSLYETNQNHFDETNDQVTQQETKNFTPMIKLVEGSKVLGISVPYNFIQEYVNAVSRTCKYDDKYFTSDKTDSNGKGMSTRLDADDLSDTVTLWEFDSATKSLKMVDGQYSTLEYSADSDAFYKWAAANGKKPGEEVTFFVGYAFKHHTDGYHLDGHLVTLTVPYESVAIPTNDPEDNGGDGGNNTRRHHNRGTDGGEVLGARRDDSSSETMLDEGEVLGAGRPQTGDSANTMVNILVMAASALAGGMAIFASRKKKED